MNDLKQKKTLTLILGIVGIVAGAGCVIYTLYAFLLPLLTGEIAGEFIGMVIDAAKDTADEAFQKIYVLVGIGGVAITGAIFSVAGVIITKNYGDRWSKAVPVIGLALSLIGLLFSLVLAAVYGLKI